MRKKRRHYRLLEAEPVVPELSSRAQAIVTIVQWGFWFAIAGILVAFLLILSLFTHFRVDAQTWLRLWPASVHLMLAGGASQSTMGRLALWSTVENGLLYCAIGLVFGFLHVGLRALRRHRKPQYN
ncbi:MAG: hypothetical protein EPN33_13880 [Acidobacteria bacterium]|nr:MAG: hypothetical protein EPN33_13880 [Acidobacteriota bacterium]